MSSQYLYYNYYYYLYLNKRSSSSVAFASHVSHTSSLPSPFVPLYYTYIIFSILSCKPMNLCSRFKISYLVEYLTGTFSKRLCLHRETRFSAMLLSVNTSLMCHPSQQLNPELGQSGHLFRSNGSFPAFVGAGTRR